MRVAWFSPLPPVRSGIAAYSAALIPRLTGSFAIDAFAETNAYDFVWMHRRAPYDLVVYHLGNASCHDYIWAYLARYPGLVVVHDPRLHHARARQLLSQRRFDDYRREFWYDHPDAPRDVVEYAVEGLSGPIYYTWSMLGVVVRTARMVAVHNPRVAADLQEEFPGTRNEPIRLGTPAFQTEAAARGRVRASLGVSERAMLFAAFGTITAEKRVGAILRAVATLARQGADVHLVLAGDASDCAGLDADLAAAAIAPRVHVIGYVPNEAVGDYLAAADACLCLRWPTALETSASWVQCLAAARPTLITDLAHLVDVPTVDLRNRHVSRSSIEPVAIAIDLLDEEGALLAAMRALTEDRGLRETLGRAGRAYWSANHTVDAMVDDYRRVIAIAASQPAPHVTDLPEHFLHDHTSKARTLARDFSVDLDILRLRS